MMQASVYGRVGQEPREINTKSGNSMTVASIAVSIDDQDAPPLWIGVVAFGRVAETLQRHSKGDLISVSGRVQRNTWTSPSGEKREQLQVIADALVSAKTVRPSGGKKRSSAVDYREQSATRDHSHDLNDPLPF